MLVCLLVLCAALYGVAKLRSFLTSTMPAFLVVVSRGKAKVVEEFYAVVDWCAVLRVG